MSIAVDDEDLMRRFLLGDARDDERDAVEHRIAVDGAYFEALCALEEDLMLMHIRDEMPVEWRPLFARAVLDFPPRRKRLEDLSALEDAVSKPAPGVAGSWSARAGTRPATARWRRERVLGWALAAALAFAILGGTLLTRRGQQPSADRVVAPQDAATTVPSSSLVATFVVAPGASRAELAQANVFRIPDGVARVDLSVRVEALDIVSVEAVLRPVDGGQPAMNPRTVLNREREGTRITISIDRPQLPAGDYVPGLTAVREGGTRESLPSSFFSVV